MIQYTDTQIEILAMLSDEKGHAGWDLAEMLGKYKSNLVKPLKDLNKEVVVADIDGVEYRRRVIYREIRPTTRERSRHPDQSELPYFINKDLCVFESIIDHFNGEVEKIKANINTIIIDSECRARDAQTEKNLTAAEREKLENDLEKAIIFDKHNVSYWRQKLREINDLYERFIQSQYTNSLIKQHGLIKIMEIMNSLGTSKVKRIHVAESALDKGFITEEEMETIRKEIGIMMPHPQEVLS